MIAIVIVIFVFGLIIGSFLNVCILRIPVCGIDRIAAIPLPIVRNADQTLRQYSGGELAPARRPLPQMQSAHLGDVPDGGIGTGLLFLACYLVFGLSAEALKWAIFAALLIVLTITDLRERILPDKVNFVGLGMGLLLSLFTRPVDGTAQWLANRLFAYPPPEAALSFADALIGAGVASGLLWLVAEGYFRARGREGMGLGDVKMMAMAGAFLGLQRALLTILLGSLLGSVIGIAVIAIGRKGRDFELPFGTFLGAGAILVMFFGSPALDWYRAFAHV